jgi:hypothetical protein
MPSGRRLPYPGLRSFQRDETDLFFGREASVNQMIRRLAASRFLAVLGASGSGKSSLVRTGLLDGLDLGLLAQAGSWWRVIDIRPGGEPLRNLARGLCPENADDDVEQMRAFLLRGPRSVAEWAAANLAAGENLLLLVDQFEELFRYQHYEGRQEAEAFVALLIESARSRNQNIYVTLTMRSEFLGACALFGGLAEAMNEGQYLTPRMTREQCREAIEGPAAVCGFKIEPALVNRLLNDLSDFAPWEDRQDQGKSSQVDRMVRRSDQLPLLQHALNRLWIQAAGGGGDIVLKLEDYDGLGGLRGALNQHAREIMDTVGAKRAPVTEQVFRALTVGANIAEAVRRPTRLGDLVRITGAPRDDVVAVCDAFRAPGCNFLAPFAPAPLRDDTIIDISHESLIRQWSDLSGWLEREARDADAMRRLGVAASLAGAGAGDLLRGRELANLETWRSEAKLPRAWAERYTNNPDSAFGFLEQSIVARKADENAKAAEALQAQRTTRRRWAAIAALALGVAGIGGYSLLQRSQFRQLQVAQAETARQAALAEEQRVKAEAAAALAQTEKTKAESAAAEATRQAQLAQQQKDRAEAAQADLDRQKRQIEQTIQTYVAGSIDKQQRDNQFAGATDMLTALARQIPTEKLPADIVDRLAWQSAAQSAHSQGDGARLTTAARPMTLVSNNYAVESDYSLWRSRSGDETRIFVVDRKSLQVIDRFEVSADDTDRLNGQGDYFIAPDGKAALLIAESGRLLRWSSGQKEALRVLDRRWLKKADQASSRTVASAAFDVRTGDIALVFRQFGADFLTVLPDENADQAQVWPIHRLSPDGEALRPSVVGVAQGKPLIAFETVYGVQILRVDLASKTSNAVLAAGRLHRASPQPEYPVVRLEIAATLTECANDGVFGVAVPERAITCVMDYDLVDGSFSNPRPLPAIVVSASNLETRGIAPLRASAPASGDWSPSGSLDAAHLVMARASVPSWGVEPAASTPRPDIARLTAWRRRPTAPEPDSQTATVVSSRAGLSVYALDGAAIVSEGTLGLDRQADRWGELLEPERRQIPEEAPLARLYVVDGTGKGVAAFAGDKLHFLDADGQWNSLKAEGEKTCVDLLSQGGAEIVGGSEGSARSSPSDDAGEAQYSAIAISAAAPEFLLAFSNGGVARLAFKKEGAKYGADVVCPPNLVAGRVVAVDYDTGHVALFSAQTGKLGVLSGERFTLAATLVNETVNLATFVGADLAVVTDKDRLLVGHGQDGGLLAAIANPLPGADAIYAMAGSLALARTESAAEKRSLSLAVMSYDPAAHTRGALTHLGFLPLADDQIQMGQLLGDGRFDVVTADNVFRFELPAVAPASALVGALQPLADQTAFDVADKSLLGLLATAMAVENGDVDQVVSTSAYARCAGALHRWQEGNPDAKGLTTAIVDTDEANGEEVRDVCASVDWPTPLAAVDLRSAAYFNQAWPPQASILLAQAVGGDSQALRSLLSWANSTSSDEVRGLGAEDLLDSLNPEFDGPWSAAAPISEFFAAAAGSVDPYAQLAIARAAETEANPAKAVFHYMLAERLLVEAGSMGLSASANFRKMALANQLGAAQRAEVAAAVAGWLPEMPAVNKTAIPADLVQRISADIDRLQSLSARSGNAVGYDLLRLHLLLRLNDIADEAEKNARQDALSTLLLSRNDWPEISISDRSELVTSFRELADAIAPRDEAMAMRLRMAGLRLIEHAGEPVDMGNRTDALSVVVAYQQMQRDVVKAGREKVVAAADTFEFGSRAIVFSTVRFTDAQSANWAQSVLEDRMALAEFLMPRPDARAARAATLFWLAINRFDYLKSGDLKISEQDKAQTSNLFTQAYRELAAYHASNAEASPDDMAVFVSAVTWALNQSFKFEADDQALPPEFDQARIAADKLYALGEKGQWTAAWNMPHGYTRLLLENQLLLATQLSPNDERIPSAAVDMNAYRLRMRNIMLGAERSRIVNRGGADKEDDDEMASGYSNAPAYAVAFVAGRELLQERIAFASECDRLTAHEADPQRRAPGRKYDKTNMALASVACEREAIAKPADETTQYQLARTLSDIAGREDERLDILFDLARSGYAVAYNNLSATGVDKSIGSKILTGLSDGYSNRIFRDNYKMARTGLMRLPAATQNAAALRWMAERAAEVGSFDANLDLAEEAEEPAEKAYRLRAALAVRPGLSAEMADTLRTRAEVLVQGLSQADQHLVEARLEDYRPTEFFADVLTPEAESALRAAPAQ